MQHVLFLPLACLVTSFAWAGPLEDARRYYEDALRSFNEKEYKAATIQLKNALQLTPNNLPARILLGKTLLRAGNGAAAEKEIRLAQKLGADPSLTLLPLAKALNQQKKYAEVVEQIPEFGVPYDLQVDIQFQRGNAYLGMRQLTKAQEAFQSALRSHSDAVLPTVGLAMVALKQGKFEEADKLVDGPLVSILIMRRPGTPRGPLPMAGAIWIKPSSITPERLICYRPITSPGCRSPLPIWTLEDILKRLLNCACCVNRQRGILRSATSCPWP